MTQRGWRAAGNLQVRVVDDLDRTLDINALPITVGRVGGPPTLTRAALDRPSGAVSGTASGYGPALRILGGLNEPELEIPTTRIGPELVVGFEVQPRDCHTNK